MFPKNLQLAIEQEIEHIGSKDISDARKELTQRYRSHQKDSLMTNDAHRLSYLATRMPATFAVNFHIFQEVKLRLPDCKFETLLDLGSGPGTVMWAANEIFDLKKIELIEKDSQLISIGKRLSKKSEHASTRNAEWFLGDLTTNLDIPKADLITLSYAVGELAINNIVNLIERCWQATEECLVIVEPGTPQGFERIRMIRRHLIQLGAFIVAPCPHAEACPMADGDWCHFAERVDRSSLHRRIKEGDLSYEDEKYSYIAVSKKEALLPATRVLRHPMHHSGHVNLVLCTPDGLKKETISRKKGDLYKLAKKLKWGSPFEFKPNLSPKS